jgi:hypothetical protein
VQGVGVVLSREGDRYLVQGAQGAFSARRAASCLLAPETGDRVWFCGDLSQGLYLSAVLERGQTPARISLRADELELAAAKTTLQTDEAVLSARKVTGVGREATWSFASIKVVSDLFESFADRLLQFARWSQRSVDGLDQVRARQIDHRAEQSMQLSAQNLIADASQLVKIDGEQIHLG